MPNWCTNEVEIYAAPDLLAKLKTQLQTDEEAFDFNTLIPMPEEIKTITCGSTTTEIDGEKVRLSTWRDGPDGPQPVNEQELIAKHGASNWYDWCIKHWGTKWNASYSEVEEDTDYLCYTFDTAWSPPEGICEALRERYPEADITWFYREDGQQFAGYL